MSDFLNELIDLAGGAARTRADAAPKLDVSVVIPTFGRPASLPLLLRGLEVQDLDGDRFEVIVVDDGSPTPIEGRIGRELARCQLRILRQENSGPGAARNLGAREARGELLVFVDDDMRVGPGFLRAHLSAHATHLRRVVLGRMAPDPRLAGMPLFERFHAAMLKDFETSVAEGVPISGVQLYSGNFSVRRESFLELGGFNAGLRRSEDRELGIRCEKLGYELVLSSQAESTHCSDHTDETTWLDRGRAYGSSDSFISGLHPEVESADPWRFMFLVSPVSRLPLLVSSMTPEGARAMSRAALAASHFLDVGRLASSERLDEKLSRWTLAGTTFAFGVEYFAGVGQQAGSAKRALLGLRAYLGKRSHRAKDGVSNVLRMIEELRADRDAFYEYRAKYRDPQLPEEPRSALLSDLVERIGIQICGVIRLMGCLEASGHESSARAISRAIRHVYGADIHWKAQIEPGLVIVHGQGLVIGHGARVGRKCILFHNVTLGEGRDARSREVGSPTLGDEVHVGPGACLIGPISIASKSKVAPGTVLMHSIPAAAVVSMSEPRTVLRREMATDDATEGAA
ncbi:MAG: glycosyltransferase [Deltaproteobacteria bacterium]|nr:glycosyltransferase [Deltaproteobacteria bacterium]